MDSTRGVPGGESGNFYSKFDSVGSQFLSAQKVPFGNFSGKWELLVPTTGSQAQIRGNPEIR